MNRILAITVILLFLLTPTALAHPGRTDANGGHWNHSTGEYHYHTGEYAGKSGDSSSSLDSSLAQKFSSTTAPTSTPKPTSTKKPTATPTPKATTRVTATPKTTDSATLVSSKTTSANPQSKKNSDSETNPKWIIAGGVALLLVVLKFVDNFKENARLVKENGELRRNYSALLNENKTLKRSLSEILDTLEYETDVHRRLSIDCKELQNENECIRANADELFKEIDELEAKCKKLSEENESLRYAHDEMVKITAAVENRLPSGWVEQLDSSLITPEALVYVFEGSSDKYHTRLHGNWKHYKLLPISKAIEQKYVPCNQCVFRKPE